jgi:hypothetical protein
MPRTAQDRQVILTQRDDQFRHGIQPVSPPKKYRDISHERTTRFSDSNGRLPTAGVYYPPSMGGVSHASHSSAAALARKSSYPNFTATLQNTSKRTSLDKVVVPQGVKNQPASTYHPSASSNKENLPPSQSRVPTSFDSANRVPISDPFAPMVSQLDPSLSMRDEPVLFSAYSRYNAGQSSVLSDINNKHSAAHTPSNTGIIKGRKEGFVQNSPHLLQDRARHDQSLLPPMHRGPNTSQKPSQGVTLPPSKGTPAVIEIIDVDAIDAIDPSLDNDIPLETTKPTPFMPSHKLGMSSIDSTGRIERNLYSALGPRYGGLGTQVDSTTNVEPELTPAPQNSSDLGADMLLNASPDGFEPAAKRKRQCVSGEEVKESPVSKRERGSGDDVDAGEEHMLQTKLGSE